MQDAFAQIASYLLGVWRHRWLALAVAWIIALPSWYIVAKMPESYVASARIYVDTNSILRPLMRGLTITPNIDERISMMSRTLLSRPNLEKLARMTDLDLKATTEAQKDALIKDLQNSISLTGSRGDASLYSISVSNRDRDTARKIAQALITVFIETSMSDKRQDSSGAQSFLEQQLSESESRLIEAENKLAAFKQRHVDVLPGDSGDYYARLQLARDNLDQTRLQLREMNNRRLELKRQLEGEEPVFMSGNTLSQPNSALDSRIQTMQLRLDELLSRYTENHPEIRRLNGLIAALEEEKQAAYAAQALTGGGAGSFSSSPVYQGMRSMLAETEARIAELSVRASEYEFRVEDLNSKVKQIPEVEAELKQLNRDYTVISSQHQQMLERRESARLSEDVEKNAGDVNFRVIDPPFVPQTPSEPNKLLLNAGVLLLALAGGGAFGLLIALLHPIVTDARMLAHTTGMPLLGIVTFNRSSAEVHRARWHLAGFAACSLALLLTFAGVTVIPGLIA